MLSPATRQVGGDMMRAIGCVRTTSVGDDGIYFKAPVVKAGQVLWLSEDAAATLRFADPHAFVDITPKSMFEGFGLELPHRHALFFTEPCPTCPSSATRFTVCTQCNNTKRRVYL
jgi:hypothetical protein